MYKMLAKKRVRQGVSSPDHVDSLQKLKPEINKIYFLLQFKENDRRPYLDVRIFGKKVRALLDSGASHTILGKDGLQWIK